jgi:RNA-binding protein
LITLTAAERSRLRARAHPLNPVVQIGDEGMTEAVVSEVDRCLLAHELIKIRVAGADREGRDAMLQTLSERLGAAAVQHIGRVLVLFRPKPEGEKPPARPRRKLPRATKRSFQSQR